MCNDFEMFLAVFLSVTLYDFTEVLILNTQRCTVSGIISQNAHEHCLKY